MSGEWASREAPQLATAFEWAIRVEQAADLGTFPARLGTGTGAPASPWDSLRRELSGRVAAWFGPDRFTRLYFGSEFCHLLAPSLAELQQAWQTARDREMGFTLLTSFVADASLARLRPLLAWLSGQDQEAEVVVNDWGTLAVMRRDFPGLRPVLGRLLARTLRDPRLAGEEARRQYTSRGWAFIGGSGVTEERYSRFLGGLGIGLVGLDALVQGLAIDLSASGLAGALHLPLGHVASGRLCLLASLHHPRARKFVEVESCGRECRDEVLELRHGSVPLRLFQRGNTVVSLYTEAMLGDIRSRAADMGIRRLVFEWA